MGPRSSRGKKPIVERDHAVPTASISYPFQRPVKRHRSGTTSGRESGILRPPRSERRLRVVNEAPALQIRVDDRDNLERWFKEAFVAMQQVACRIIAKVWIKRIHPRKQSTHPYNGGVPRSESKDPERTRPPYWPLNVIHREPDHIGRDDRTSLLVHLLMSTPLEVITNPPDPHNRQLVTAANLLKCLESKRSDSNVKEGVWEIIEQVCRARDLMEQYEAGEIDGDALVFLNDYANGARLWSNDSDDDLPEQALSVPGASRRADSGHASEEEEEHCGEVVFTPTSSSQGSPTDRSHADTKPRMPRRRGTGVAESSSARQPKGRRSSRPPVSTGRSALSAGPQPALELPYRLPVGMRKPESQADNRPPDNLMNERRASVHATTGMSPMVPMMAQQLPQKAFGCDYENHMGATDMLDMFSYAESCPPPHSSQPWLGMMPNMGPEPPEHLFGFHPHMVTQPPESALSYFGQAAQEAENRVCASGPLIDHSQYPGFDGAPQFALPLRIMDPYQQGMMSPVDVKMEMTPAEFYAL
ncbi:hypothetical protein LTR99_001780 [Exophiala xenobiotica]|uniref:Subtelomeric hrmA-associated cluster protein AFUB-079030/YDR124W-like helical bundle domain-containing protein n=1 Tax=Vermiconidia calcicola TaxID=1690605 RepID=A0AAV9Q6T3_9PEZI|nr:hypothetical protein H2202_009793 [Exophiala xenobiotica]KAK5536548.1 hypothetical protein LTR25_005222 [Vermiconidia calcicola]KAK5212114.1 hypothetical protein LTR41_002356 [Exophiala xenobiotica]KAK5225300.1 hypothetical protein LTR47_009553 [Exophiala xenobiotica]KAK5249880.1 hypothetical protein LTS06_005235 [Exophiala xenobiotica]